jgi:hypothetical protein
MKKRKNSFASRGRRFDLIVVAVVVLLVVGAFGLGVAGLAIVAIWRVANRSTDQTVVAVDGSCQVMLPAGWKQVPEQGTAILSADGLFGRAMFDIERTPKADLAPNFTYRQFGEQYIQDALTDPEYQDKRAKIIAEL